MERDGSLRSPLEDDERLNAHPALNHASASSEVGAQVEARKVRSPFVADYAVPEKKRGRRDGGGDPLLKTVQFVIYMTRDQRTRIEEHARARGMRVSPFIVQCVLGQKLPLPKPPAPPIPEVNQNLYFELARIGNNLNQLARRMNTGGGEEPTAAEVLETLDALIPLVGRVRQEVIGVELD